jgi:hypothetical protein
LLFEITHLHRAVDLLKKYEKKDWWEIIPDGEFPSPLSLHENIDYVRKILGDTVQYTSVKEDYLKIKDLPQDADFFKFQNMSDQGTLYTRPKIEFFKSRINS